MLPGQRRGQTPTDKEPRVPNPFARGRLTDPDLVKKGLHDPFTVRELPRIELADTHGPGKGSTCPARAYTGLSPKTNAPYRVF